MSESDAKDEERVLEAAEAVIDVHALAEHHDRLAEQAPADSEAREHHHGFAASLRLQAEVLPLRTIEEGIVHVGPGGLAALAASPASEVRRLAQRELNRRMHGRGA